MSERKFNIPISERVSLEDLKGNPPRPTSWGPPPLHPFLVEDQQQAVNSVLEARREENRPVGTNPEVAGFVNTVAENHFAARMLAGYDNLEGAALIDYIDNDITPEERRVIDRLLSGKINPAELAFATDRLGIRGAPFGVASHYYGRDMRPLERLRAAHDKMVSLFSGKKLNESPAYKIKDATFDPFSGQLIPSTVHITRKRNLARLADHVVDKERSDIVLVTSGLTPATLAELAEIVADEEAMQQELTRGTNLHTAITSLLRSDRHRVAVPIDTTIYKFDESIPTVPAMDDAQNRKRHPNLAMIMTRQRLVNAGVPVNDFEAARLMPLRSLVAPKRKK